MIHNSSSSELEQTSKTSHFMLKVLYIALASIICFRFHTITSLVSNLDPSWVYALNIFHFDGIVWGSKFIFTYGPLGFVFEPMPIGSNVMISLIFWFVSTAAVFLLFLYVLFSKSMGHINSRGTNLFLSFLLLYAGAYIFGRFTSTYITSFLILCLLVLCWDTKQIKFFIAAALLSVLSMFLKFNSGASDFITLLIFAGLTILLRLGGGIICWFYVLFRCYFLYVF